MAKPDKPWKHDPPDDPGGLETRLKRLLDHVEETLNKHEIEQEILATVKRIEQKLGTLGGGMPEAEILVEIRRLAPIVTKLEQVAE